MHDRANGTNGVDSRGIGIPAQVQEDPLVSVALSEQHQRDRFCCSGSARVQSFLRAECNEFIRMNYCRVFVIEDDNDPSCLLGYYSISPSLVVRSGVSGSVQKRLPGGIPIPVILIGFMGRDDNSPKGIGAALILDAARRVHRNRDIAAWGLTLDAEGGPANPKLWNWYIKQGFSPAKILERPALMYAPLAKFMV